MTEYPAHRVGTLLLFITFACVTVFRVPAQALASKTSASVLVFEIDTGKTMRPVVRVGDTLNWLNAGGTMASPPPQDYVPVTIFGEENPCQNTDIGICALDSGATEGVYTYAFCSDLRSAVRMCPVPSNILISQFRIRKRSVDDDEVVNDENTYTTRIALLGNGEVDPIVNEGDEIHFQTRAKTYQEVKFESNEENPCEEPKKQTWHVGPCKITVKGNGPKYVEPYDFDCRKTLCVDPTLHVVRSLPGLDTERDERAVSEAAQTLGEDVRNKRRDEEKRDLKGLNDAVSRFERDASGILGVVH